MTYVAGRGTALQLERARRHRRQFLGAARLLGTVRQGLAVTGRRKRRRIDRCEQVTALGAVDRVQEFCRQRARGAVVHDLARPERDGARTILQSVFDLVERHEDGDVVVTIEIGKDVHHASRRAWIERRDRLVGDDELRPLHERACNRRTLLLAAGQLRAALERMIRDADARKRTHRTLLLGMREVPEHRAQRRQPAEQAEADIRQHRQPRNQIESVSYTHLDVYKRQSLDRATRSARRRR